MSGKGVALQPQELKGAVEAETARRRRLGDGVVAQVQLLQEGEVLQSLDTLFVRLYGRARGILVARERGRRKVYYSSEKMVEGH